MMPNVKTNVKGFLKNILYNMVTLPIQVVCSIGKLFGKEYIDGCMVAMCKLYEKKTGFFCSYRFRPMKAKQVVSIEGDNDIDEKIAIVIQGPIFIEDHFTLETVRIYGKLYPSVKVILSTWEGGYDSELNLIKQEKNCIIVLNQKPEHVGSLNSNLQCVTTLSGIREAKKLNCQYVLKTRGDWRIYSKGALRFMVHMLEDYPCTSNLLHQKKRIIVTDIATSETSIMFYPFWFSDLFMFGDIDDMFNYWNFTLDDRDYADKAYVDAMIRTNHYTWTQRVSEEMLNEGRYPMDYIRRMTGKKPEITVKEYWSYMKDYFMVMPKSILDGFWYKYGTWRYDESASYGTCFRNDSQQDLLTYNFDFVNWMNLCHDDLEYKEEFEDIPCSRFYRYHH